MTTLLELARLPIVGGPSLLQTIELVEAGPNSGQARAEFSLEPGHHRKDARQ